MNKYKFLVAALIIALAVVAIASSVCFSQSIYTIGSRARVKIEQESIVLDLYTKEYIGKTKLFADLSLNAASSACKGTISVQEFPVDSEKGTVSSGVVRDSKLWVTSYDTFCDNIVYKPDGQIDKWEITHSQYKYYLCFYEDNAENPVLLITDDGVFGLVVIPADDLDAAKACWDEFYQRYISERNTD